MALNIPSLMAEIEAAPLVSPFSFETAVAVVQDLFRMAGRPPVPDNKWTLWKKDMHKLWPEQIGILAHVLASTSLRKITVQTLRTGDDRRDTLFDFFAAIEPLSAEMVRANRFRQEEFLRKWAAWCGVEIEGETNEQSLARLEKLDYRTTLREYEKAESARRVEEARRRQLLEEARQREAAARAWRE